MSAKAEPLSPGEENLAMASVEILKGKLFFMALQDSRRPKFTQHSHYFTIDEELKYDPFYDDFGPLNLAQLYKYCTKVEEKLNSPILEAKKIVHYTSSDPKKRVNAAYLIGSYAVLFLNMKPLDVFQKLTEGTFYTDFRDASTGFPVYTISLKDTLHAVAKAKECGFFNPNDFDISEYLHYETVENGDLNWVVPEKFLAFAGPQSLTYKDSNKWRHAHINSHRPESYLNYFKALNVTTVVRLNNKCYDASKFTDAGIQHFDLIFVDGGTPSDELVLKFLKISEEAPGAVAVHCKAGLGRTGSMIACYIMKWYRFTAREAIAWLRICRPASIIGHQQHWLETKQVEMWMLGMGLKRPSHPFGVYSHDHGKRLSSALRSKKEVDRSSQDSLSGLTSQVTTMNINNTDINKNVSKEYQDQEELTQGDHLQNIKMERQPLRNQAKVIRNSWPVLLNATSKRSAGSWPIVTPVARRTPNLGKITAAKRSVVRKKNGVPSTGKAVSDDNNRVFNSEVTPSSVNDTPTVPLRRSQRILEPRLCKSVVLR